MNQAAHQALTAMWNSFALTGQDYRLLAATYDTDLANQTNEAIIEAAHRFRNGKVPGQSDKFSPSQPEFVAEVERQEEFISLRNRPRLERPPLREQWSTPPFMVTQQKKLAENSHLPVLYENIGHDRWLRLSRTRQIPTGAKWVACLGIIYGPEPKQSRQAAE